jgi:hypothetical protein
MKNIIHWDVGACSPVEVIDVSEELFASIFMVESEASKTSLAGHVIEVRSF